MNTYIILTYFTQGAPSQRLFRISERKVFEYSLDKGFEKVDCSLFWKEEERDVTKAYIIHSSEELRVRKRYWKYTVEDSNSREVKGIAYDLNDKHSANAFVAVVQNSMMNNI